MSSPAACPVRLYHVSYKPLQIGQPINPLFGRLGNAPDTYELVRSAFSEGRKTLKALLLADVLNTPCNQDPRLPMYLKETIFELVRSARFDSRPSRFESVFLFHTSQDAIQFQRSQNRQHLVLCESQGATLIGLDMGLSGPMTDPLAPIDEQLTGLIDRATRYWQGRMADEPRIEILATGGQVIVKEVVR